jgi:hypothetical protein
MIAKTSAALPVVSASIYCPAVRIQFGCTQRVLLENIPPRREHCAAFGVASSASVSLSGTATATALPNIRATVMTVMNLLKYMLKEF